MIHQRTAIAIASLATSSLVALPLLADEGDPLTLRQALTQGEASVHLRYRFESVDDDAFEKPSNASTLRTSLGYRTKSFRGFSFFVQAENVAEIGTEDQFANRGAGSLDNGVRDRPVIADPEATEVEQLYLRLERGKTRVELGRQAFALGDQRFVGPVGWRQNHQSFDALKIESRSLRDTVLTYAFLTNVNRVFGDNRPMASHLLQATTKRPFGKLTAYGLLLDFDRPGDQGASRATYGLELAGTHAVGPTKLLWETEIARQQEHADNPLSIEAGYLHGKLGVSLDTISFELGYERLEGSPEQGSFQTPLATLHKWNGWADKFLRTPENGLEDLWFAVKGKAGKDVSWQAVYHDFSAESAGDNYGNELDLMVTCKSSWGPSFGAKAAFYDADTLGDDTRKLWLWTTYSF